MKGENLTAKKGNVAYLRVSTEAQTEKYGLDVQRQKITEYCEKNKITISRWYVDGGYSGAKMERPEINKLLSDASNGMIKTVYIYKLDRMSRDVIDTLTLLYKVLPSYDVNIVSMTEDIRTENPMDKMMVTMNAAMNQYEREVIYMRTRAGMVERVKKGLWMGGGRTPYGYYYDRNDGILHPKEDEAENVRKAYQLYIDGYSCNSISSILGLKGERIVAQILKRKSNIGLIEYKGEVYKGLHEPIVDKEVYDKAMRCMMKRTTNSHINNDNMLTGLCYCGKCGARMRYQKWGKDYHKLVCYSHYGRSSKEYMKRAENCDTMVMAKDVEAEVEKSFKDFSIRIDDLHEKKDSVKEIRDAIQKANAKIKKYYSLYVENESQNLLDLAMEEEKRVETLKEQLEIEQESASKTDMRAINDIKRISDVWGDLTSREKNKVLKECIEKIIIKGDEILIYFVTF
jgi:site-specific DNA recombinase